MKKRREDGWDFRPYGGRFSRGRCFFYAHYESTSSVSSSKRSGNWRTPPLPPPPPPPPHRLNSLNSWDRHQHRFEHILVRGVSTRVYWAGTLSTTIYIYIYICGNPFISLSVFGSFQRKHLFLFPQGNMETTRFCSSRNGADCKP